MVGTIQRYALQNCMIEYFNRKAKFRWAESKKIQGDNTFINLLFLFKTAVLRIRDVYPGSNFSSPDPRSRVKRFWIPIRIQEFKYF
jgi:hypothetical protein